MVTAHGSLGEHQFGAAPQNWPLMGKLLPYWLDESSNVSGVCVCVCVCACACACACACTATTNACFFNTESGRRLTNQDTYCVLMLLFMCPRLRSPSSATQ